METTEVTAQQQYDKDKYFEKKCKSNKGNKDICRLFADCLCGFWAWALVGIAIAFACRRGLKK